MRTPWKLIWAILGPSVHCLRLSGLAWGPLGVLFGGAWGHLGDIVQAWREGQHHGHDLRCSKDVGLS
eukprot:3276428-Pyramimonas_sp.AAC.1